MSTKKSTPKLAFALTTTTKGYSSQRPDYATAHVTIYKVNEYEGGTYTDKVFELEFGTHLLAKEDTPASIQPAAYYQFAERWQYREWYGPDIKLEARLYSFEDDAQIARQVVRKVLDAQQEYNLSYRYHDPLELLIQALIKAGYCQVYQYKYKWYLNSKGYFSREDRQNDLEPQNAAEVVYPWEAQDQPVAEPVVA